MRLPLLATKGLISEVRTLLQEGEYGEFIHIINALEQSNSNINLLLSNLLEWQVMVKKNKVRQDEINLNDALMDINQTFSDVAKLYGSNVRCS